MEELQNIRKTFLKGSIEFKENITKDVVKFLSDIDKIKEAMLIF